MSRFDHGHQAFLNDYARSVCGLLRYQLTGEKSGATEECSCKEKQQP